MTDAAAREHTPDRFVVRLGALPAHIDSATHGGYKLDRESEVGRTGALIDWHPVGRGPDAGVPVEVARALAVGLCAACSVAGCTSELPGVTGAEWRAVPGGYATRLPLSRGWWQQSRAVTLLGSEEPDVVERLFDDDEFPWAIEQQVLFLSPPGVLPRLDAGVVMACFGVPIRATISQLTSAGVVGLFVAGVDGDVGGLYVFDPAWRARVVHALSEAVRAGGGRWAEEDVQAGATAAPGTTTSAAGVR